MSDITIQEEFSLPSRGLIYGKPFDPIIKLRSMTVAEEMKRLTATDYPYKTMSEIIEACLETKLPISVYDLCLGDYQYLLHKLRVVTYGPEYKVSIRCPHCFDIFDSIIDLDTLKVNEYDESFDDLLFVKLPVSGKTVELKFQTPRDLDNIDHKKKEMKQKSPDFKDDPTLLLNLESLIKTVDGQPLNPLTIQTFVKTLPMKDTNLIIQTADLLNKKVGIDINISTPCTLCGNDVDTTFRFTSEFFRPGIN